MMGCLLINGNNMKVKNFKIFFLSFVIAVMLALQTNAAIPTSCPKGMPLNDWIICFAEMRLKTDIKGAEIESVKKSHNGHANVYILKVVDSLGKTIRINYCANDWITIRSYTECKSEPNSCGLRGSGFVSVSKGFDNAGRLDNSKKTKCSAKVPPESTCKCKTNEIWDGKKCVVNKCLPGQDFVDGSCVNKPCPNGAVDSPYCKVCAGNIVLNNSTETCPKTCNYTNICGQQSPGYISNNKCIPISNVSNNSCIMDFKVNTDSVNPNGDVTFSWSIPKLPVNVKAKCGFVDLTTPTPRPVPGLQNLDERSDSATIRNIQATTRFCLVCQFVNSINNNPLGDAVTHQWIRVIRIGEN